MKRGGYPSKPWSESSGRLPTLPKGPAEGVAKPKVNGYWRTEYAVFEDRTDRARDHAELLLLDGKNVALKTRQVFYTDWASLPESATPPSSEEN